MRSRGARPGPRRSCPPGSSSAPAVAARSLNRFRSDAFAAHELFAQHLARLAADELDQELPSLTGSPGRLPRRPLASRQATAIAAVATAAVRLRKSRRRVLVSTLAWAIGMHLWLELEPWRKIRSFPSAFF